MYVSLVHTLQAAVRKIVADLIQNGYLHSASLRWAHPGFLEFTRTSIKSDVTLALVWRALAAQKEPFTMKKLPFVSQQTFFLKVAGMITVTCRWLLNTRTRLEKWRLATAPSEVSV